MKTRRRRARIDAGVAGDAGESVGADADVEGDAVDADGAVETGTRRTLVDVYATGGVRVSR